MKKSIAENALVFLLMLIVALVATWPLVGYFFSAIPCNTTANEVFLNKSGDSLQLFYWFWLLKDNLFSSSVFLQNPYEFNMVAGAPSASLYMYPFYFLYLLFSPLGDIAAYNSLVICSYVLTGFFTYLLVKLYTGSRSGALVAAFIYTLVPLRVSNLLGGHLNGFIYYLIPAILYFFEKTFRNKSLSAAILCGLCLWWLSLLEVHLIYYMCVFLGGYIPLRILFILPSESSTLQPVTGWNAENQKCFGRSFQNKWLPLVVLYGIGIALTVLYQTWVAWEFQSPFLTSDFWIILGLYPVVFFFFMVLLAVVLVSAFSVQLSAAVCFLAQALSPLCLLPLFHLRHIWYLRYLDVIGWSAVLLLLPVTTWFSWKRNLRGGTWQVPAIWCRKNRQDLWLLVPVAAGLGLSVGWVMFVKKVFFAGSIAQAGRTIKDVRLFSPQLADLYTQGSAVYLGAVPLLLIVYALVVLVRQGIKRDDIYSTPELTFLSFFSFSFLLAYVLGAGLSFGSSSLYIVFFDYFPFFNYPRVPDRIMSIAFLCGAVVAGFAIRDIQKRFKGCLSNWKIVGFVVFLSGFFLFDFGVGKPVALTVLDRGQDIYQYIKKNIDDQLLLEIPLWPGDSHQSSLYEYYVTLDQIRRVNGYTPIVTQEYLKNIYNPLETINMGLLDRTQYQHLRKMGVRFITVHDNLDVFPKRVSPFPPLMTVRRLMNSPFLEYVPIRNMIRLPGREQENKNLYLFRVLDEDSIKASVAWKVPCSFFIPSVYHAPSLPHITGGLVLDNTIKKQVLSAAGGKDRSDYLSYGPYEELPAGEYRVYYRLRTNKPGSAEEIARLDVTAFLGDKTQQVLVGRTITGKDFKGEGYQDFSLQFSVSESHKFEFRTWFSGNGDVWLEKILLTCAGQDEVDTLYEAEDLLGDTGLLVQDRNASGGMAVSADVVRDNQGRMVYGPYRTFPAGKYRVTYFLRADSGRPVDSASSTAVELSLRTDENLTVLGNRTVELAEISGEKYKGIDLDMTLNRDSEVSFDVYYNRQANILVDRVEIKYLGPADGQPLPF